MAEPKPPGGKKSADRAKWIIIAAIAGLGLYLYLRSRKQAAAQPQSAASQGSTNPNPSVPVYQLSGTYNGPYTPYNIVNNGVTQPAGYMPGGSANGTSASGYYGDGTFNINSTAPVQQSVTVAQPNQ